MYTEEDDICFVLPYSPILEDEAAAERWDDDELWFMPLAEPRRSGPHALPCQKCGGALYAEIDVPGIADVRCLACSETVGQVLHSDLERWVGKTGMAHVESHTQSLLWIRDEAVA